MKCCICHKQIKKYGNNPFGALDLKNRPLKFGKYDRCCDECNLEIVIPGRILLTMIKRGLVK